MRKLINKLIPSEQVFIILVAAFTLFAGTFALLAVTEPQNTDVSGERQ
ncbi:hypothetical protein [Solimonas sp. SE-A11]|nr:hypothetical protein [Solimonas sp. SE-A11]MDM4770906.1 hypothetical protein [Solimonas sp. SE-A11]